MIFHWRGLRRRNEVAGALGCTGNADRRGERRVLIVRRPATAGGLRGVEADLNGGRAQCCQRNQAVANALGESPGAARGTHRGASFLILASRIFRMSVGCFGMFMSSPYIYPKRIRLAIERKKIFLLPKKSGYGMLANSRCTPKPPSYRALSHSPRCEESLIRHG